MTSRWFFQEASINELLPFMNIRKGRAQERQKRWNVRKGREERRREGEKEERREGGKAGRREGGEVIRGIFLSHSCQHQRPIGEIQLQRVLEMLLPSVPCYPKK
jgi:hypothetical protein